MFATKSHNSLNKAENLMKLSITSTLGALLLGATAMMAVPAALQAQDFAGETIEWTIPFGVGGGTDVWARFFAPQLSEALPGKPTVVVLNVPGGGSISGANQFAQRASHDGLSILGTSVSTQYPAILGDPRVRYDYAEWTAILASPTGGVVYIDPKYGVTGPADIEKLRAEEIRFASQGATALEMPVLLAMKMMGLKSRSSAWKAAAPVVWPSSAARRASISRPARPISAASSRWSSAARRCRCSRWASSMPKAT